jgi:hypothetical protein
MQKWTGLLYAALVIAAIAIVVVLGRHPAPATPAAATAAVDAGAPAPDASAATTSVDAGDPGDAEPPPEPMGEVDPAAAGDAGSKSQLGNDAPKSVVFGVILVQYRGAQYAPSSARSRDEALTLAKQIAEDAKKDFKAALAKGDKGSLENAGRMPRGVLEPGPEAVLFGLAKDAVSDPVDTPTGFWIVHRIE